MEQNRGDTVVARPGGDGAPRQVSVEPVRLVAEPPAQAPLEVPTPAGKVEVRVEVGRVVVRQEFAPPLPPPPAAARPRSAFADLAHSRRHVDRRWY